jgi:hypothetical protein
MVLTIITVLIIITVLTIIMVLTMPIGCNRAVIMRYAATHCGSPTRRPHVDSRLDRLLLRAAMSCVRP